MFNYTFDPEVSRLCNFSRLVSIAIIGSLGYHNYVVLVPHVPVAPIGYPEYNNWTIVIFGGPKLYNCDTWGPNWRNWNMRYQNCTIVIFGESN